VAKFVDLNASWQVDFSTGTLRRTRDFHPIRFSYTGTGIKWYTDEAPGYIRDRILREAKDRF